MAIINEKLLSAREIAEKYVYGRHDALTDRQEIEDMVSDIEYLLKANDVSLFESIKNLILNRK